MRKRVIYFGPPGTGKTSTLLQRLEKALQQGVSPDRIAFLTFTRRAQQEALMRVRAVLKLDTEELPYFRTIHSMAYRALELKECDIVSKQHLAEFGKLMGLSFHDVPDLLTEGIASARSEGSCLLALDNFARLRGQTIEEAWAQSGSLIERSILDQFVRSYREMKADLGLLDFTDILLRFAREEIHLPVDVAFIDEAQDLSSLQWLAALQAIEAAPTQYIAGDDDQEIYRWAGADAAFFVKLEAEREILRQSHRLPRTIHTLATSILARIRTRVLKDFRPRDAEGVVERQADMSQIEVVQGEQWLWLVRNRYLIPDILDHLRLRTLVYSQHGASSIREDERDAIYSWERLERGRQISGSHVENLYGFLRGNIQIEHGHKALKEIRRECLYTKTELQNQFGLRVSGPWFEVLDLIPAVRRIYYRALLRTRGTLKLEPQIEVDTIHGSKGAQCDHVALFLERSRRVFTEAQTNSDEEERVWYVGATRAKERLVLVQAQNDWGYQTL